MQFKVDMQERMRVRIVPNVQLPAALKKLIGAHAVQYDELSMRVLGEVKASLFGLGGFMERALLRFIDLTPATESF